MKRLILLLPLLGWGAELGREVGAPRHLADDEEFRIALPELLAHGRKLFSANWTEQEGGGRPLSKGNGRPLSDPSSPLKGPRGFNRLSAPDANSCAGCHNQPFGHVGGGGDFATNVFVLGQRFDFATLDPSDSTPTRGALDESGQAATLVSFANSRSTTGMFGAGYLEMLAREMTVELQRIRDSVGLGESKELIAKGVSFGRVSRTKDGAWVTSEITGLSRMSVVSLDPVNPPSLVIRPWHQAGNAASLREFTNTSFHQHHGMQSTERFGLGTDLDGDGVVNELTRADVTAVALFQAAMPAPGRVIPRDPLIEKAVLDGERLFAQIGCARCHVPALPLSRAYWKFTEPSPYNPPLNLRLGQAREYSMDLGAEMLPLARLPAQEDVILVPAYTDFKLHDITSGPDDPNAEPLDMNQTTWTSKFREGNRRFLTKRLWGAANEPPYFHHGLFTTMRAAILAHSGEALKERKRFEALSAHERDCVIEFLKTLQVLTPGTRDLVVDENYRARKWPPAVSVGLNDVHGQPGFILLARKSLTSQQ